jgi:hypothetical protein
MEFKQLSDDDLKRAWERASKEFPELPALREIHFIRYLLDELEIPISMEKSLEPKLSEYIREKAKYWIEKINETPPHLIACLRIAP